MTCSDIILTSNVKKFYTFWNLGFTPLIEFLFVANVTEIFSAIYQRFPTCASNCKIKSADGWEKDSNEDQIVSGILSVGHIKESYKTLFVCVGTSGKAHYYRYMSSWALPQMLLWEKEHNKGIIGKTAVILSRTSTSYGKRLKQRNKWCICKKKPTLRISFLLNFCMLSDFVGLGGQSLWRYCAILEPLNKPSCDGSKTLHNGWKAISHIIFLGFLFYIHDLTKNIILQSWLNVFFSAQNLVHSYLFCIFVLNLPQRGDF